MKKIAGILFFFAFALAVKAGPAEALTFIDTIYFPNPTSAADEHSGTGLDYIYTHSLTGIPACAVLNSAAISLTHSGNSDDGPAKEVWHLVTPDEQFIGRLGRSEGTEITDSWNLGPDLFEPLNLSWPPFFKAALSEQTSYNGETLRLIRSRLEIDYTAAGSAAPSIPEPEGWLIFTCGFLLFSLLRVPGVRNISLYPRRQNP